MECRPSRRVVPGSSHDRMEEGPWMGDGKERKARCKPKYFQLRLPFRTRTVKQRRTYAAGSHRVRTSSTDEGTVNSPYVRGSTLLERSI